MEYAGDTCIGRLRRNHLRIAADRKLANPRPGEAGFHQSPAGFSHLRCGRGIIDDFEDGVRDLSRVEIDDPSGIHLFYLREMTFFRDDHWTATGKCFANRHAESLLATGKAKGCRTGEGFDFLPAIKRADEMRAIGKIELRDAGLEVGLLSIIRTGDDKLEIGIFFSADRESIGEIIEALFKMNPGEKKDVGLVIELGVRLMEGVRGRNGVDFLEEDAVGNDNSALMEAGDVEEFFLIFVEHMEEGSMVEHFAIAKHEGDLLFE